MRPIQKFCEKIPSIAFLLTELTDTWSTSILQFNSPNHLVIFLARTNQFIFPNVSPNNVYIIVSLLFTIIITIMMNSFLIDIRWSRFVIVHCRSLASDSYPSLPIVIRHLHHPFLDTLTKTHLFPPWSIWRDMERDSNRNRLQHHPPCCSEIICEWKNVTNAFGVRAYWIILGNTPTITANLDILTATLTYS